MSQHDFNIANQGFPATRADLNNALAALASNSSGTSEPSTTYAGQFWNDTTNNLLKFRNDANDGWITFAKLDQATNEWEVRSSVFQAVDSAGISFKTDDGTTRATMGDDGNFQFNSVDINGGTIDGAVIGGTTPAAITATTITGTDLTLSGGVYLGGTGSDNKLDDYEVGTFTPTITGGTTAPTLAYTRQDGYYTKVGDIVHCNIYVQTSSRTGGSGNLRILGLPFASLNAPNIEFYGSALGFAISSGRTQLDCNVFSNGTSLGVLGGSDNSGWTAVPITGWNNGTTAMRISISYRVA